MKPLSKKRRYGYLVALILIFVVATPLLILYASGYRLGEALKFFPTGGLYIATAQSGIEIYINEEFTRKTSLFQKNVLIQNLQPENYKVRVVKKGYQEWSKTLQVFPETVTEAYTFMLPTEVDIKEISAVISQISDSATTTATSSIASETKENPEYLVAVELFEEPVVKIGSVKIATTTKDVKIFRKLSVENVNGKLEVEWIGNIDSKPVYFCLEDICDEKVTIEPFSKLSSFDFFPGREDLIILGLENGVYVTEIDNRSGQNVQKIIEGKGIDFKVLNGDKIYLRIDKKYYTVSL